MARTKLNQRTANRAPAAPAVPMGATGGRTPPSKLTVALFSVSIIAAIWALAMMTSAGRIAYVYLYAYAEYYMGVLTLVSLSTTIMLGLVSTDRLVLSIRQRVLLQSAHRTFGIIAVGALGVHLWAKLVEGHIRVIDIFVPFLHPGYTMFIGFGTISAYILVLTMWTGIIRAKFIGRGKPWMWRAIHSLSYLMWPIALVHGLNAGRPAKVWVIVSYIVCVLGVVLGLAVRISVSLNRKKDFASQASNGTGMIKPVGQMLPTSSPAMKRGGGGRDGALDRWAPAATPAPPKPVAPVSPAPAPPMTGPSPISAPPYDEAPRGRSRRDEVDDYDDAPPRQRRRDYDDEMPAPRQRRDRGGDRYDEPTGTISRRAIEEGRRRYDEEEAPPARPRRRVEEERFETQPYEPEEPRGRGRGRGYEEEPPPARRPREIEAPPRGRRYEEDDRYEDAPRPRGPRYPDDEPPARRGRGDRDRGNVDRADSGRHSRSEFVDAAGPQERGEWRDSARDGYDYDSGEVPTLVDMASRRARRTTQQEAPRGAAGRGARGGRGRNDEMADDDGYWRQLRGEAQ